MTEYQVGRQVADQAGRIRHEVGIRLTDAPIAATAPVHGLTTNTRNLADFQRIPACAYADNAERLRPLRSTRAPIAEFGAGQIMPRPWTDFEYARRWNV